MNMTVRDPLFLVGMGLIVAANYLCGQGHIYIGIMCMHSGVFTMMFSGRNSSKETL